MRIMLKTCLICNTEYKTSKNRNQVTCSLECRSKRWKQNKTFSLDKNPCWKGGVAKYTDGYIVIKKPEHPFADKNGYVREHRLTMEKHLGRFLKPKEVVHHINEIKTDNRIENLVLFENNSNHFKHHYPKGSQVADNHR